MSYCRGEASVVRPFVRPSVRRPSVVVQFSKPYSSYTAGWISFILGHNSPWGGGGKSVLRVAPPVTTLVPPRLASKMRKTLLLPQILTDFKSDGAKL